MQQTSAEVDLEFVPLLALHTRQGFYADPVYSGNRNRIGWDVIGFPAPAFLAEVTPAATAPWTTSPNVSTP
jgi:gluconate 2-dehydrogenase gamma chain